MDVPFLVLFLLVLFFALYWLVTADREEKPTLQTRNISPEDLNELFTSGVELTTSLLT